MRTQGWALVMMGKLRHYHLRHLPSAPWRYSQGRFLLASNLPTRGSWVLLKSRVSSKDSASCFCVWPKGLSFG